MNKLLFLFLVCVTNFCQASGSDTLIIKSHLTALTKINPSRSYENLEQLNWTANYIDSVFKRYSDSVSFQKYLVEGSKYRNVICSFGTENSNRIIVGAHYDVYGKQEGADDNASGVSGLLELARLLKGEKLNYRIDLVAFTLEEPPYFETDFMGSYIHAKALKEQKAQVYGMISLEMIGYFSKKNGSQTYPYESLSKTYGTTGDFIALVNRTKPGAFAKKFCAGFKTSATIKTFEIESSDPLMGVSLSDHMNYWKFGFEALMITDTSFFRNTNYHTAGDKMETLDIASMAKVIDSVLSALTTL